MIKPPIEELLKETPGRFALVITAARELRPSVRGPLLRGLRGGGLPLHGYGAR